MISNQARKTDRQEGDDPGRSSLRDYATAPVKFKKQIADFTKWLRDRWNEEPLADTEAARRDIAPCLDLLAVYSDGSTRIDDFLKRETSFDDGARDRLKQSALSGDRKGHSTQRLGQLMGLEWQTRKRLKITNIDAIDTPADEVREALRKEYDVVYSRTYREAGRLFPKTPSAAKRNSTNTLKRRLAAIHAVIGHREISITDLCEVLSHARNGPFVTVSANSLRRVVARSIGADVAGLFTEVRAIAGRPDLRPQMWVMRRPKNDRDYGSYFAERLADFTSDTAADVAAWFYSDRERKLREGCGLDRDDDEFMKMARARREELAGQAGALP